MKKTIAAAALAAGVVGMSACGSNYSTVAHHNSTYCVNQSTGEVMPPQYCQVGSTYYSPGIYDFWIGYTYGHSYNQGTIIQHNYYVTGKQVNPSNSSARKAAGIPVSGSVSNGAKSTTTTKAKSSTPAKPQNSPSPSKVSGSTGTKSTTPKSSSSFGGSGKSSSGGSTSRSSSGFGSSGGSSSRSSSSSGGRK